MVCSLLTNWAYNQVYYKSIQKNFISSSTDLTYNFNNVSTTGIAVYNPKLHITVKGDFNGATEGFSLYDFNDNLLTSYSALSAYDCKDTTFEYIIPAASFANLVDGTNTLKIRIEFTADVDLDYCDESFVKITLESNLCASATSTFGTPSVTFPQSSVCKSDKTIYPTMLPIGGILRGEGVVQSGLNFHINTQNLSTDTTYEYQYIQTNGDGCEFIGVGRVTIKKSPADITFNSCPEQVIEIPAPAKWYGDENLTQYLSTGNSFTPTHTRGSEIYYLENYQLKATGNINQLRANQLQLKDISTLDNISVGGFAVTPNQLYLGSSDSTLVFNPQTLDFIKKVKKQHAMFSDLATGKLYSLYNTTSGIAPNGDTFTAGDFDAIAELNSNLEFTGIIHSLGRSITFEPGSVIAPGFGEVLIANPTQTYVYELANLDLVEFRPHGIANVSITNFASYGFLLTNNGIRNVYIKHGANTIKKTNVTTNSSVVVADMADSLTSVHNLAFSPWTNKWYFTNNFNDELSNFDKVLASANVTFATAISIDTVDNCISTVTITIPTLDLGADVSVCDTESSYVIVSDNLYVSYTWNGNNTNNNLYPVTTTSEVRLEVVDTDGCILKDTIQVTFTDCLSATEIDTELAVSIFPNPTTDVINFVFENQSMELAVRVYDLNGRELISTTTATSLSVENLTNGVYVVQLTSMEGSTKTIKFIKE